MTWTCSTCGRDNPEGTKFCGHCGAPATATKTLERDSDLAEFLRSYVSTQVADRVVEAKELTRERRLITALFADLSGFTPLADRLDPEELLDVIDPVIERITNVVGKYEGYVDKFAGDALLAFFGAPVAHEDDPERALLAALEMHEELARILPELPEHTRDLTLHIGVNSGQVIARVMGTQVKMDYSVLGDAVILAQRLESAAPAGETYVGMMTHELTEERFDFDPVGDLVLKGKKDPVPAWRLKGRKVKPRFAATRSRFIGRTKELETIDMALDSLFEGHGAVVSVSGEPGVGKSRLATEVRDRVRKRGGRWLTARCVSYGSGIAYYPYVDLLRRLAGIGPQDAPDTAVPLLEQALETAGLAEVKPYFARLLGLPAPELEDLEPEAYRRGLHDGMTVALERLAEIGPIVIALEDLHWSDASSVELTTELGRLCERAPIALYLTARPEAVPVLVEVAAGAPEVVRYPIQLEPFGEDDTRELVQQHLDGPVPAEVVELVGERAVGNPFFVEEMVRSLQESGGIVKHEGAWRLSPRLDVAAIPPTIEGVLASRIDMLPRRATAVLQVSSVIGRRVLVPLLREVEAPAQDVDANLQELIDAGFLEPAEETRNDELLFHHALVQDVAYSRLLRRHRRDLHRHVADVAERLYGAGDDYIDLLARHLYLGEAGGKAIDYLVRAGERAKRLFANDEALVHFDHAVELTRSDEENAYRLPDILLNLGDLNELRGDYKSALAHYEEVKDLAKEVRAWRGMASALRNQSLYGEAMRLLDDAFAVIGGEEDVTQLWLERAWTLAREGDFPGAAQAARDGLKLAREGSSEAAELLLQLARAETVGRDVKNALDHARWALEIFEFQEDMRRLPSALRILADTYRTLEHYDEAAAAARRGLELAELTGNTEESAACLVNLGMAELGRGALQDAIDCDLRAIEVFERIGHASGRAIAYGNLAEKLMMKEDYEGALQQSFKALEIARSIGHAPTIADVAQTQASIFMRRGDLLEAAEVAEEAAGLHLEMGVIQLAIECLTLGASALEQAGDTDRALSLLERARSLSS